MLLGVVVIGVAVWLLVLPGEDTTAPSEDGVPLPSDTVVNPNPTDDSTDSDTMPSEPATEDYVGLSEVEAEALATANNVPFRVVERDGEALMVTEDYRPGRINAVVVAGVVTAYTVEGSEMENNAPAGAHDELIGMTEADAEAYAEVNDVPVRIGFRDGEPLPVTMDYRPGRITLQIENEVVTGYTVE